jgi:hypothetical protein
MVSRMWHFPTVVTRNDSLAEMRNFLAETLHAQNGAFSLEPLAKVRHAVTYRDVTILPFRIAVAKIPRVRGAKMIRLENFSELPVSNLTRKIARAALAQTSASAAKS